MNVDAAINTTNQKTTKSSRCFLTGADSSHEWMLPWWVENIQRHMPGEKIVIADFGIKNVSLDQYENIEIIPTSEFQHVKKAWFLKPLALLKCQYDKVCWLDIDCEVLKPCLEIFDYAEDGKLALTKDLFGGRRAYWATGVVLIDGKPKILEDWNTRTLLQRDRGDQESLYKLIRNQCEFVVEMPQDYQVLRLALKRGIKKHREMKIIHWTGVMGKSIIYDRYYYEMDIFK